MNPAWLLKKSFHQPDKANELNTPFPDESPERVSANKLPVIKHCAGSDYFKTKYQLIRFQR
jgi:hypothetical protein